MLTRTKLREILKLNNVVQDGTKAILKERVIDGEKFGRLGTCPECGQNGLKVKDNDPGIVVCSGTIPAKSGSKNYTFCKYSERSDNVTRIGHWLGKHYFKERIEESKVFTTEINLRTKLDRHIMEIKDKQAIKMMNMFQDKTEFAKVGDVVRVRIDKRDRTSHPSMYRYVIGVVYQRSEKKFAYVITTKGIFAKRSLGENKGLKAYTFSPRDYEIAREDQTIHYDVECLRKEVLSPNFDEKNYKLVTTSQLRTMLAKC